MTTPNYIEEAQRRMEIAFTASGLNILGDNKELMKMAIKLELQSFAKRVVEELEGMKEDLMQPEENGYILAITKCQERVSTLSGLSGEDLSAVASAKADNQPKE